MKKLFSCALLVAVSFFGLNAQKVQYSIGKHIVSDLWDGTLSDDVSVVETMLREAAKAAGCTVLSIDTHKFDPQGLTSVAVLSESHISIHTWPEHGYAAVDVYTCCQDNDAQAAVDHIINCIKPQLVKTRQVRRGDRSNMAVEERIKFAKDAKVPFGELKDIRYKGQPAIEVETRQSRMFGQHILLTLEGCDVAKIDSGEELKRYAKELVDLIDMKAYGDPFCERFAEHSEFAAGYSLAQMIETSLISGHFSPYWKTAYIDIFSCKPYDTEKAVEFTKTFFGASEAKVTVVMR